MMTDQAIGDLAALIGKRAACAALGRSRASYYRRHRQSPPVPRQPRTLSPQPRALSPAERAEVLGVLHHERFVDQAPATIYATLLDEDRYLCSVQPCTGCCTPKMRSASGVGRPSILDAVVR
jgi:putative transposase